MKIALIQTNAGGKKRKNLDDALRLTLEAISRKAEFICLPEVFNYRGTPHLKNGYHSIAENIPGESTVPFMILARAKKIFILIGSVYEKVKETKKIYNTSVLIDDKGRIKARYRKINLFDARLGKKVLDEAKYFLPGRYPVTADVKDFKIGLSICYDLRFPGLYQQYKKAGVDIITVPSSFTKVTGQAHWEILLRARAIEGLAYVLAPNQFGITPSGVATHGNSIVVDPWGKIVARGRGQNQDIVYADVQKKILADARGKLPGIVS